MKCVFYQAKPGGIVPPTYGRDVPGRAWWYCPPDLWSGRTRQSLVVCTPDLWSGFDQVEPGGTYLRPVVGF